MLGLGEEPGQGRSPGGGQRAGQVRFVLEQRAHISGQTCTPTAAPTPPDEAARAGRPAAQQALLSEGDGKMGVWAAVIVRGGREMIGRSA